MKKAIVVVSNDTSDYEVIKGNLESVENNIKGRFPDYEVRSACSASIVIQNLSQGNDQIQTMQQVIRRLQIEGYQEVICISLKQSYISVPEYPYVDHSGLHEYLL